MRKANVAMPVIGLIAGTRVMLGIGLGMLISEKLKKKQRHTLGWTLFLAGAGATVPLLMHVLSQREVEPDRPRDI